MKKEKIATRQSYGEKLEDLGEKYNDIVVFDADLSTATKTSIFAKKYPERFFFFFISAIIEEVKDNGIEKVFNKKHFKEMYKKYCIDDNTEYKYIFHGEWQVVEK